MPNNLNNPTVPQRSPLSFGAQFVDLFLINLTNWRWSWQSSLVIDTLAPVLSILGLGVFARDLGTPSLVYVLTGNMVLALMFGMMRKVENYLSFMRASGGLDYFAALPIHKAAFVLAIIAAFFVLGLPSLISTLLIGSWFLGLQLQINLWLIPVIVLSAIPFAGLGALIAILAPNFHVSGSLNLLFTLVLTAIGPVIVPPNRLPMVLITLGQFSPATYAASALRQTLLGPITPQLAIDLIVLLIATLLILALVTRKMDWRAK